MVGAPLPAGLGASLAYYSLSILLKIYWMKLLVFGKGVMMLIRKKMLLGLILLVFVGGCEPYMTPEKRREEWEQWKEAWRNHIKALPEYAGLFTDPGEKEAALEFKWMTGMSVEEVEIVLQHSIENMSLDPPWLAKTYSSAGGYETYEADFRIKPTREIGFKDRETITYRFKNNKLYDWSSYFYEHIDYSSTYYPDSYYIPPLP